MSGGGRSGGLVPGGGAAIAGIVCICAAAAFANDEHPAAPLPLALIAAAIVCFVVAGVQARRAKARDPRSKLPPAPPIFPNGPPPGATVLTPPGSIAWALPAVLCGVCLFFVGSFLLGGIPSDTQGRVCVAVGGAGAVACLIWVLRWRHKPLPTLIIAPGAIVQTSDGHTQMRAIVRRPDSRLRISLHLDNSGLVGSGAYDLYDEAADGPRIPVNIFGFGTAGDAIRLVKDGCLAHGWSFLDPEMNRASVPGSVPPLPKVGTALSLIAAGVLGYIGVGLLVTGYRGKPVKATVVSCDPDACKCTWMQTDPATGRQRSVSGNVESLGDQDEGKQVEIVVARGFGFTRSDASRFGYIVVVFAMVPLLIGILLPWGWWKQRRAALAQQALPEKKSAA